nr:alpha/beta hydrolase [Nocardiopsis halotolerans]
MVVAVPAQADETAPAGRGTLDWAPCEDIKPVADENLECATLTVPLARTSDGHRIGRLDDTVELALSRVPATGEARHTLLVNPGGPGSAGRRWASYTHWRLPAELREVYDVVSFDPRGVGGSTPSVACDPAYFTPVRPDTVPAGATEEAELRADAEAYAQACADNTGLLLEHMRTEDTAHDMDAIREALGVERIDYLGYSYGSYLGAVYSALHPGHVRSLVLDSVVDPDKPWYESNLAQSRSLNRAAEHFFDWTARHDDAYGLGTTGEQVAAAYYALRSELAEEPAGGTVGPTELESAAIVIAYSGTYWPSVAGALAARINDAEDDPLVTLYEAYGEDAGSDRGFGTYLAVQCTDSRWPGDWSTWSADAERTHQEAPFMGWHNIWYNAPCAFWSAGSGDWFQIGDGDGAHPAYDGDVLLVHATEDGATPVEGAFALRERLPGASLVVEEGGHTHGVALTGNACVDEAVTAYLLDGRLPARAGDEGPDVTCEARPEPRPRTDQSAPGTMVGPPGPVGPGYLVDPDTTVEPETSE